MSCCLILSHILSCTLTPDFLEEATAAGNLQELKQRRRNVDMNVGIQRKRLVFPASVSRMVAKVRDRDER